MLNGTDVRQVTAVAPLSATIVYDFANPTAVGTNNIELAVDLSGTTTALAGKQDFAHGATMAATAYASKTGTWTENLTSTQWSPDFHRNGVGYMKSNHSGVGPNTASSDTITYDIPSAFLGGSVYLNTMAWVNGGYADVFMTKPNSYAADQILMTRLNSFQNAGGVNNRGRFDGVRVDRVATGYPSYSQIHIKVRKGVFRIMGVGFTKEIDRPVAPLAFVHSDNVFGDAASLSDTRLKANQQTVSADTLISIFDTAEVKEYDFRPPGADVDGQPLPSERRVGFIADDVKAALPVEWSNLVGSKLVAGDEFLTLDYSRLIVAMWGTMKELRARVAALEA